MRARCLFVLLSTLLVARAASAANAFTDPHFDIGATEWTPVYTGGETPGASKSRDADSGTGFVLGALDLQYSNPSGAAVGEYVVKSPCFVVAPSSQVVYGGQLNFAVKPGGAQARAQLVFFTATDCSLASLMLGDTAVAGTTVPGKVDGVAKTFTRYTGAFTAQANAVRMQMWLAVSLSPTTDQLARTVWDRVFLGPPGTHADLPFGDGFESGDTAYWVN